MGFCVHQTCLWCSVEGICGGVNNAGPGQAFGKFSFIHSKTISLLKMYCTKHKYYKILINGH